MCRDSNATLAGTMSDTSFTLHDSYAKAGSLGLVVVLPKPNELFIDIDNDEDYEVYEQNLAIFKANELQRGLLIHVKEKVSKSGLPNRHITLTFGRTFTALERINLQAMLGSDRKHEFLSLISLAAGHPSPTMFFEKPDRKKPSEFELAI